MSREALFTAFFFVALGFLLYQVYQVFSGFLAPAAWATVLALVFYPAYRALLRRLGRPTVAALIMTLLVYFLVLGPSVTLSGVLISQARNFYGVVQEKIASGEAAAWISRAEQSRAVQAVLRRLPEEVRRDFEPRTLALRAAQASTETVVATVSGLAINLFRFLVDFLIMILLLFFFFRDGESLYLRLRGLLPMEPEDQDAIFGRLYDTISAVVQGMTATALAQALLALFAFWILDFRFALLLAFATALASFVPVGGAALVWGPSVFYLLGIGTWGQALFLLAYGAGVISLVDNIVKPLIIGDRTKIPTLFLFLGILGGIRAYGVIGVFLGPALLGIIIAFLHIYREDYGLRDHKPVA